MKVGVGRDPVPLFLELPGFLPQGPGHGVERLGQFPQLIPAGDGDVPGQLFLGGLAGAFGEEGDLAAHAGGQPDAEAGAQERRAHADAEDHQFQGRQGPVQFLAVNPHQNQVFPGLVFLAQGQKRHGVGLVPQVELLHLAGAGVAPAHHLLKAHQAVHRLGGQVLEGVDHQAVGVKDGHLHPGAGQSLHETLVDEHARQDHPHQVVLVIDGGRGAQGDAVLPLGHAGGGLPLEAGAHQGVGADVDPDAPGVVNADLDDPGTVGDGEDLEAGGLEQGRDLGLVGLGMSPAARSWP